MSSTHANSLRTVMLDSLYFAAVTALLSSFTATIAAGADTVVDRAAEEAVARSVDDDNEPDDNEPTGDPDQSPAAARETNILGMKLYEERPGVIRVTDVAAASPAWDAGVRPGDQLTSVDGVKLGRLAPWVEDMAKLLGDREDGHAVAAEVVRDGAPLDLRIRLLVSTAAEARDKQQANEAMAKAAAAAGQQGQQQPGQIPVAVGRPDGDRYYDRYAGYGGGVPAFFGGGDDGVTEDANDDRMANRAVAHLSGVNTVNGGARGQVGIAAFRTSGQGVAAMVSVRGLPQGSYVVGIDDGSAIAGGIGGVGDEAGVGPDVNDPTKPFNNGQENDGQQGDQDLRGGNDRNQIGFDRNAQPLNDPRMQNQHNLPNQQPMPNGQQPMPNGQPVPQQQIPAGGAAPAGGTGATDSPTGGEGASLADPRGPIYLAQQLDPPATAGGATEPAIQSGAAPIQDRNIPAQNLPNQDVRNSGSMNPNVPMNDTNGRQNPRVGGQNGLPPESTGYGGPSAPQFLRELGVLNVGPDGVGQLQTQLDGMQVQHLAGLSVTVASTMSRGGGDYGPGQQRTEQTGANPRAAQQMQNQPGPNDRKSANVKSSNIAATSRRVSSGGESRTGGCPRSGGDGCNSTLRRSRRNRLGRSNW